MVAHSDGNAGTKLSKRIGWLNNNAGLTTQIKFSEVKDLLSDMGEVASMKLLKDLETKGASIRDPTGYLKAAARRAVGGSALEAAPQPTFAYAPAPVIGGVAIGASPVGQAPGALSGDIQVRLKKRVGWLNANAGMQAELVFDKVFPLLFPLGDREAMDLLKKLEEHAAEVRDPTGWVISACRRHGGGAAAPQPIQSPGFGIVAMPQSYPTGPVKGVIRTISTATKPGAGSGEAAVVMGQLKKRIGWLNSNVALKEQIVFDKVGALLAGVGYRQAMEILKHLEEKAETVNDPTAYVAHAARRAGATGQGGPPAPVIGAPGAHLGGFQPAPVPMRMDHGADEKIRKRIGWLNSNVALQQPLTYDKVAAVLGAMDIHEAMALLKKLEENAGTVRDPDSWVASAARRIGGGAAAAQPLVHIREQAMHPVYMGYPASDAGSNFDGAADEKLRKRIGWLNRNGQLSGDLKYDRVAPVLLTLDSHAAMEILKNLEENASTVRDPTAYVVSAASRRAGGIGPPGGAPALAHPIMQHGSQQRASSAGGNDADSKLRRRIGWLNRNGGLLAELRYDQVGAALSACGGAMEILKALEESAPTIPDPNAYVLAACAEGGGVQPQHQEIGGEVSPEEKLNKRITWMNNNLPLGEQLSFDRLAPELLALDMRQAMDVLKKLEENAGTVRDPHAWVSGAVRRLDGSGGGGAGARTESHSNQRTNHGGGDGEERLRKRVTWLNANVSLSSQLDFDQILPSLMRLEISQAMAVLKTLEDNAQTVLDPNAFVSQAMDFALAQASTASSGDSVLDDALRKRVSWMNANVPLATPLNYDQIAPSLLAIGERTKIMEVLKGLENNAMSVPDPNEHVIRAANAQLGL